MALAAASAVSVASAARTARADEPISATEPRVMREPGEVTSVIDAFDDGDPFDLNVTLGFEYAAKSAKIRRETAIAAPGLTTGGYTSNLMNVANYSETTSKLIPRIDIGIYKDLAAHITLPIILSSSRELTDLDGTQGREGIVLAGSPGRTLFTLPFTSPDRSGIEHIAVGLDYNLMNQARDRTKPTWLLGIEGRFSVGEPMHACNPTPLDGQVECADPTDVDRNGEPGDPAIEGNDVQPREPGVTRGTIGFQVHTMLSKRIKYVEPYGGFTALFEFYNESSDFGLTDLQGSLVNTPPLTGTVTLGMMVHPFENREKFGRLTLDFRMAGTYRSEGRDYSELFDALGSTDEPTVRNPNWAEFTDGGGGSVVNTNSERVYFTGLTDVQQYGSLRTSASVLWQASEYVKFQIGVGYRLDSAHGITGDQPCNPDFKDEDASQAGPCRRIDAAGNTEAVTGKPNPNYRGVINAPGRRFYVDDSSTFDVFASGVVMF